MNRMFQAIPIQKVGTIEKFRRLAKRDLIRFCNFLSIDYYYRDRQLYITILLETNNKLTVSMLISYILGLCNETSKVE